MSANSGGASGSSGRGGGGPGGGGHGGNNQNTGPRGEIREVKETANTPAMVGDSGMIYASGETKGAPDKTSAATVPYTEVYADYSKAAEKAMAREKVPPAYRTKVKEYFNRLR